MQLQYKLNRIQFIIHFHFIDNRLDWYYIYSFTINYYGKTFYQTFKQITKSNGSIYTINYKDDNFIELSTFDILHIQSPNQVIMYPVSCVEGKEEERKQKQEHKIPCYPVVVRLVMVILDRFWLLLFSCIFLLVHWGHTIWIWDFNDWWGDLEKCISV